MAKMFKEGDCVRHKAVLFYLIYSFIYLNAVHTLIWLGVWLWVTG